MTDPMHTEQTEGSASSPADETFAWSPESESNASGGQGREWLTQLQGMIENLATQAAPVIREVGIKAAELAAVAGEKAGPVAQRAAELTGQAGQKLAERSRDWAAEMRRDRDEGSTGATTDTTSDATDGTADKPTADVA